MFKRLTVFPQESYFSLMKAALKPNGIVCSQGGTFWTNLDHVKETLDHCRGQFPVASYACASVPSYPSGQIGFVIGSLQESADLTEPVHTFTNKEIDAMGMKYYTSAAHRAAFTLPRYAEKFLYEKEI